MIKHLLFNDMRYDRQPFSAVTGKKIFSKEEILAPVVTKVGDHYEVVDGKYRIQSLIDSGYAGCKCCVHNIQASNIPAVREQLNAQVVA